MGNVAGGGGGSGRSGPVPDARDLGVRPPLRKPKKRPEWFAAGSTGEFIPGRAPAPKRAPRRRTGPTLSQRLRAQVERGSKDWGKRLGAFADGIGRFMSQDLVKSIGDVSELPYRTSRTLNRTLGGIKVGRDINQLRGTVGPHGASRGDPRAAYKSQAEYDVMVAQVAQSREADRIERARVSFTKAFMDKEFQAQVAGWGPEAMNGVNAAYALGMPLPRSEDEALIALRDFERLMEEQSEREALEAADEALEQRIHAIETGKELYRRDVLSSLERKRWERQFGAAGPSWFRSQWQGLMEKLIGTADVVGRYWSQPLVSVSAVSGHWYRDRAEYERALSHARRWQADNAEAANEVQGTGRALFPAVAFLLDKFGRGPVATLNGVSTTAELGKGGTYDEELLLMKWARARQYGVDDLADIASGRKNDDEAAELCLNDIVEQMVLDPLNVFDTPLFQNSVAKPLAKRFGGFLDFSQRARAAGYAAEAAEAYRAKAALQLAERGEASSFVTRALYHGSEFVARRADDAQAYYELAEQVGLARSRVATVFGKLQESRDALRLGRDTRDVLPAPARLLDNYFGRQLPPSFNSAEDALRSADQEGARYIDQAGYNGNIQLRTARRRGKVAGIDQLTPVERSAFVAYIMGRKRFGETVTDMPQSWAVLDEFDYGWFVERVGPARAAALDFWYRNSYVGVATAWYNHAAQDSSALVASVKKLVKDKVWTLKQGREYLRGVAWFDAKNDVWKLNVSKWGSPGNYFPMFDIEDLRAPSLVDIRRPAVYPFLRKRSGDQPFAALVERMSDPNSFWNVMEARDLGVARVRRRSLLNRTYLRLEYEFEVFGGWESRIRPLFEHAIKERAGGVDRLPRRLREFANMAFGADDGTEARKVAVNGLWKAILDPALDGESRLQFLDEFIENFVGPARRELGVMRERLEAALSSHVRSYGLTEVEPEEAARLADEAGFRAFPKDGKVRFVPRNQLGVIRLGGLRAGVNGTEAVFSLGDTGKEAMAVVDRLVDERVRMVLAEEGVRFDDEMYYLPRYDELASEMYASDEFAPVAVATAPDDDDFYLADGDWIPSHRLYYQSPDDGRWYAMTGRLEVPDVETIERQAAMMADEVKASAQAGMDALRTADVSVDYREGVRHLLGGYGFSLGDRVLNISRSGKVVVSAFEAARAAAASYVKARRSAAEAEMMRNLAEVVSKSVDDLTDDELAEASLLVLDSDMDWLVGGYDALRTAYKRVLTEARHAASEWVFGYPEGVKVEWAHIKGMPGVRARASESMPDKADRFPEFRADFRGPDEFRAQVKLAKERAEFLRSRLDPDLKLLSAELDEVVGVGDMTPEEAEAIVLGLQGLFDDYPELRGVRLFADPFDESFNGWYNPEAMRWGSRSTEGTGPVASVNRFSKQRFEVSLAAEVNGTSAPLLLRLADSLGKSSGELTYADALSGMLGHELGHAWNIIDSGRLGREDLLRETGQWWVSVERRFVDELGILNEDEFAAVALLFDSHHAYSPYRSKFSPRGNAAIGFASLGPDGMDYWQGMFYRMTPQESYADDFGTAFVRRYIYGDDSVAPPPATWSGRIEGQPGVHLRPWAESLNGHSYEEVLAGLSDLDRYEADMRELYAKASRQRTVVRLHRRYMSIVSGLMAGEDGRAVLKAAQKALRENGTADPTAWLALSPADFERVFGSVEDPRYLAASSKVMSEVGKRVERLDGPEAYVDAMLELYGPSIVNANASVVDLKVLHSADEVGLSFDLPGATTNYTWADIEVGMAARADDFGVGSVDVPGALKARAELRVNRYRELNAESSLYEHALSDEFRSAFGEDFPSYWERHASLAGAVDDLHQASVSEAVAAMRFQAADEAQRMAVEAQQALDAIQQAARSLVEKPIFGTRGWQAGFMGRVNKALAAWDRFYMYYRKAVLTAFNFPLGNRTDIMAKNLIMGLPVSKEADEAVRWAKAVTGDAVSKVVSMAGPKLGMSQLDIARFSSRPFDERVTRELLDGGLLYDPLGGSMTQVSKPLARMLDLGPQYGHQNVVEKVWNAWFDRFSDSLEVFGRQALLKHTFDEKYYELLKARYPDVAAEVDELAGLAGDQRRAYLSSHHRLRATVYDKDRFETFDEAWRYANRVMLHTHIDYENFSMFQRHLKRLFMFPVYAVGNAKFWGSLMFRKPQWAVRLERLYNDDKAMTIQIGEYELDLKYLLSPKRFGTANATDGPLDLVGLEAFSPLMRLMGHLGWGETMSYRGGIPLATLLARESALVPLVRKNTTYAGVDAPAFIDWSVASVLSKFSEDLPADEDMLTYYNREFYRDILLRAAEDSGPGEQLDFAEAEQAVALERRNQAWIFFLLKVVAKREGNIDWLGGGHDAASDLRRNVGLMAYDKGDFKQGLHRRELLYAMGENVRQSLGLSDDSIPGFLSAKRLKAREPWMEARERFNEEYGWVYEGTGFDTAQDDLAKIRRARRDSEVEGYIALQERWSRLLENGPQAGPGRKRLKDQHDVETARYLEEHPAARVVFGATDDREKAWERYRSGGFDRLLSKYLEASDIKDYEERRRTQKELEEQSRRFAKRFGARLSSRGYEVLDDEFPSLRQFLASRMTPLERRVQSFYDMDFDSYREWYAAYKRLPRDVKAVVDGWRAKSGKGAYPVPGSGGGGFAAWRSRYPGLAAMFATRTSSFDQWWAQYLALPVSEQMKLNEYRRRKGKKPLPVGPAARNVDWSDFGPGRGGSWYGVSFKVLDQYFAIPKNNKRARREFLEMHPELDRAFDLYEQIRRESAEREREALLARRPDMQAYVDWYEQEAPLHAPKSGSRGPVEVSYSGEDEVPERKLT